MSHVCDTERSDDSPDLRLRGRPATEAQMMPAGLPAANAALVTFYPVLTGSFAQPRTLDVRALLALS